MFQNHNMKLSGLVSLVTGGAGGLGRATVKRLAAHTGAKVISADLDTSDGAEIALECANVRFAPTDVTSESDVVNLIDGIKETEGRLDVVVNCAGVACAFQVHNFYNGKVHKQDDFVRMLTTNTAGTFNVIRNAVALMARNEPKGDQRGIIVNCSAVAGLEGQKGQAAFAASKAAVAAMTLPMARDLAERGIRVNAVAPGLFQTALHDFLPYEVIHHYSRMTPNPARLGKPEEFAELVEHIVTNDMINGEVLRLDGALRFTSVI